MKPRLLVVAHLHPKKRGSLEAQLLALAASLGARGVATACVFAQPPVREVADALLAAGATWETADFARPMAAAATVARAAARFRPTIAHCHFLRALSPVTAAMALAGVEVVVNDHLALVPGAPGPRRWLKRALLGLGGRPIVARRVAVSAMVARTVTDAEAVPPERVRIIENGVDLARFRPVDRDAARRALGLPPDAKTVVALVARTAHEKGVDVALAAFARVARQLPGSMMLVAGDRGPDEDACHRLARDLGLASRVRFLGLRDDVEQVLAASSQVWVPSRAEAFGLAAAEAMACARPVVATRIGGLPEVVRDGETGLLVASDAPAELADAALALARDEARARGMGAAGRVRAERRFGLDRWVARHLDLYRELAPDWFA